MRYNVKSLVIMRATLEDWAEQTYESRDNEENKDYPDEDRLDMLTTRLDMLEAAHDSLMEIE